MAVSRRSTTRITKSTIEGLARPAAGGRSVLWDAEVKGFGVRVSSGGVRTYVLRYNAGGRDEPQRQITIGQHGSPWTAEQARKRALDLLAEVRSGGDPARERERRKAARAEQDARRSDRMFDVLADRWFARHAAGLRSAKDIEGVLERDLKPAFAGRTVEEISRSDVADMLEALGDRSESAANKAHKWMRQMFNWLIEKGVVEHSPLDRLKRPFSEGRRTRTLSLLELVVVWVACDELPEPFRSFYRMLILLGQRLREVSNLPWGEIDLDLAEWLLPAARAKYNRDHLIPLPDSAVEILRSRNNRGGRPGEPVFTTDGEVGISGFSKMKEALDGAIVGVLAARPAAAARIGATMPDWVVHDLRRTLGTGCQAMKVPVEVTEAILNHISKREQGVRGIYQLYDYHDEKADALDAWAALVIAAVAAWERGDVEAVIEMDPVRSARIRRRDARPTAERDEG